MQGLHDLRGEEGLLLFCAEDVLDAPSGRFDLDALAKSFFWDL